LLARLERDGLIESLAPADGAPSRRTARNYAITDAGRARFRELMLDMVSSVGEYQRLFYLKVPHLEFLTFDEQIELLEHYRDYCRAAIRHLQRTNREFEGWLGGTMLHSPVETGQGTREGLKHAIITMQHLIQQWRAELDWVDQLQHTLERR
jgi:DNA-binding PadR family transcriptional regulator